MFDLADRIFYNGPVIPQFQQQQDIRVVDLPEAAKRVTLHLLDRYDAGVVPVQLSKGIFKRLCSDILLRDLEDVDRKSVV